MFIISRWVTARIPIMPNISLNVTNLNNLTSSERSWIWEFLLSLLYFSKPHSFGGPTPYNTSPPEGNVASDVHRLASRVPGLRVRKNQWSCKLNCVITMRILYDVASGYLGCFNECFNFDEKCRACWVSPTSTSTFHTVPSSPDPSLAGRHIDVDLQLGVVSMGSDARQVAIIHVSPGIPGNTTRCHGSWGHGWHGACLHFSLEKKWKKSMFKDLFKCLLCYPSDCSTKPSKRSAKFRRISFGRGNSSCGPLTWSMLPLLSFFSRLIPHQLTRPCNVNGNVFIGHWKGFRKLHPRVATAEISCSTCATKGEAKPVCK